MVNVGIVGLGFMGVTHFRALKKVRGAVPYALVSRDPKKREGDWRGVQGNFGGGGGRQDLSGVVCYETLDELLDDPKVDLVDICLPTDLHVDAGLQALEAGKDVLVEKAISVDVQGADRLLRGAEKTGRLLMVAHVLRFFPEFLLIRQLLDKGSLGGIRAARFRRIISRPTWSKSYDLSRLSGLTADLHVHDVDFIQFIFGLPKAVTSVGCFGAHDVIEHIDTQYDFGKEGPTVTAEAGWMVQQGCPFEHGYDIYYERGTLKFNSSWQPAPQLLTEDGKVHKPRMSKVDAFTAQLQEAVDAVRRQRPSALIDARLGRDSLALCLQEVRSAQLRRRIPFRR